MGFQELFRARRPSTSGLNMRTCTSRILLPALFWITLLSATRGASPGLIVFKNVAIIPMNKEVLLRGRDLFVADGKVLEITATGQKEIPGDATVIDGNGCYLLPGLIDAHVHLVDEKGLQLFLMNGVTSVRVMEGKPEHLEWRKRIESGEIQGPHLIVSTPLLHREESDRFHHVSTPEQARSDIHMFHEAGYDWVKVLRLDKTVLAAVIEEAGKWDMRVGGHNPNFKLDGFYGEEIKGSPAEAIPFDEVLKSGMASLEHISELGIAGTNGKLESDQIPGLAKEIKESGIVITPTINPGILWNEMLLKEEKFLDEERREKIQRYLGTEKLSRGEKFLKELNTMDADTRRRQTNDIPFALEFLKALSDAGVPLVAGSDTGGFSSIAGFSLKDELEVYVQAGLTPYQALRAATYEGARLLNQQSMTGTVETGKNADFILLKENPLQDIRAVQNVDGVMFGDRWYSSADLKRIDASFP